MGEIVLFENGQGGIDVRLEKDTVWLTQRQMAALFDTSTDNISLHLKNIYAEEELQEAATAEESLVVQQEGTRRVQRKTAQTPHVTGDIGRGLVDVVTRYTQTFLLLRSEATELFALERGEGLAALLGEVV